MIWLALVVAWIAFDIGFALGAIWHAYVRPTGDAAGEGR